MKTLIGCALAALSLAACAAGDATYAHRLTPEQITRIGATPVSVTDSNLGITVTWPQRDSTSGAMIPNTAAGGLGALLAMGIDAWANAEPQRRANQTADEFETVFTAEALNSALEQSFRGLAAAPVEGAVTVSGVSRSFKLTHPGAVNDAIEIVTIYQASDYSNVLKITALVSYRDAAGFQLYNNIFTYYSAEVVAPPLTRTTQLTLIDAIERSARRATGEVPTSGTTAGVDYIRDSGDARDDFLTRAEKGILVTDLWTRDNGALLRAEIANAHALITRYVLLDINRPADPTAVPGDAIIETMADGRTVQRIQAGFMAGTYEFRPAGPASRATFSNGLGLSRNMYNMNRWYRDNPPAPAS